MANVAKRFSKLEISLLLLHNMVKSEPFSKKRTEKSSEKTSNKLKFKRTLKIIGRKPINGTVRAYRIIEAFNVAKTGKFSLFASKEMVKMKALTFQTTEEIFSNGIIIGITPARHRLSDRMLMEKSSELM